MKRILLGCGIAEQAPGISANLPTPTIGVWERINIGVYMVWLGVLAVALLRRSQAAARAPAALAGAAV